MRSIFTTILAGCLLSTNLTATIIGEDNRETTTADDGHVTGIGVIFSRFTGKNNLFQCTATLIGQHFIITAAHCVFKLGKGGFAQKISFVPGFSKKINNQQAQKYIIKSSWVTRQFVSAEENGNPHSWYTDRSDIAVLQIKHQEEPYPGDLFGSKQLISDFERIIDGQKYQGNFASYPTDKPYTDAPWKETGCEYWAPDAGAFHTYCDTAIGSSGGALLAKNNNIIGIVSSFSKSRNYATRITSKLAKEIDAIVSGEIQQVEYFVFDNLLNQTGIN
ncbi:MAG: V8-like Glu-specific endopeptidase [Paraglaciecola sp.]|jgi:V8-like Glu-specific endopeptidase